MKKMHNHVGFVLALAIIAVLVTVLRTEAFPTVASVKETILPVTDVLVKILTPVWKFIVWLADLVSGLFNAV